MEQANSKNKIVRAAGTGEKHWPSMTGLEIVKLFDDLIKGNAFDVLARYVSPRFAVVPCSVSMLDEGKKLLKQVLRGDERQLGGVWEILGCLDQRSQNSKKEIDVEQFVIDCFLQSEERRQNQASAKYRPFFVIAWAAWQPCCMSSALPQNFGSAAGETRDILFPVSQPR